MVNFTCPECGRALSASEAEVGKLAGCNACGARFRVPGEAAVGPGATGVPLELAAVAATGVTRGEGKRAVGKRVWPGLGWWGLFAASVIAAAGVPSVALWRVRHAGLAAVAGRGYSAENVRANADLLALKSEAEALAIAGKLPEAHAKYRQLQQLAATREIKDALLWDLLERAKVDQDHIYTILLAKAQFDLLPPGTDAAMLPSREIYPPGAASQPAVDQSMAVVPKGGGREWSQPPDMAAGAKPSATEPAVEPVVAATEPARAATPSSQAALPPASRPAVARIPLVRPAELREGPGAVAAGGVGAAFVGDARSLTDEQIARAMQAGMNYLLAQFHNGALVVDEADVSQTWREGLDALCLYAVLTAGQSLNDPRVRVQTPFVNDALEKLKGASMDAGLNGAWEPVTYARALRLAALSVYNRKDDTEALNEDAAWLATAEVLGAYTYDNRFATMARNGLQLPVIEEVKPPPQPGQPQPPQGQQPQQEPKPPAGERPGASGGSGSPWAPAKPGEVYGHNGEPMPRRGPTWSQPKGEPKVVHIDPELARKAGPQSDRRMTFEDIPWDNSNSQYGLLGCWAAAECAVEIPSWYWEDVERHWTTWQLPDGEWGYRKTDAGGSLAMTCAGIASLFVTSDWIDAGQVRTAVAREPYGKSLAAGLRWLEAGDNSVSVGGPKSHYRGYDLFSVERVGLASGFKHFGTHDWYRELAAWALARQWPDGSWGTGKPGRDTLIETAYNLLFLARGRHPVMLSKLRFEGNWANHPRDAANLARFAARTLERGLNWQVVSVGRDWTDWLDSPVLYLASNAPPKFADADFEKLRHFTEAGGMIFTQADGASEAFNKWVPELARKLWPQYEMKELPEDHELFTIHTKLRSPHAKLSGIDNGARLLLVHSSGDLAQAWQSRAERSRGDVFQLGLNLFIYASGKADLRNRLASPYLPAPAAPAATSVKVARLKYPGNWDPEPMAWTRFSRWLQSKVNVAADAEAVEMSELKPGVAPVAHVTGTFAYAPTEAEVAAVRAYVDAGGVLLVDACGGGGAFASSAQDQLIARVFPDPKLERLPAGDPLLKAATAGGMVDLPKPVLRPFAAAREGATEPALLGLRVVRHGKGMILYSPLDLTEGLLGASTWGIYGYQPEYAQDVVRNVVLWSASLRDGR